MQQGDGQQGSGRPGKKEYTPETARWRQKHQLRNNIPRLSFTIEEIGDGILVTLFPYPAAQAGISLNWVNLEEKEFTLVQLEQASPGVSREMVRRVLRDLKGKKVECIGRGPGAKWIKKGNNT